MKAYLLTLLAALLFTVAVESATALLFPPRAKTALSFALGSLATNPLLNVCYWLSGESQAVLLICEMAAVGLEAWICHTLTGMNLRRSFAVSAAVNLLSYSLGKLL